MKKNHKTFTLRKLIVCAMLAALAIILDRFVPITFTESLKVTLTFVPVVVAASFYGPVEGAVVWGIADLLGALMFPRGAYFPGFTVTSAIKGALFGIFLHTLREKMHVVPRVTIPTVINNFIIGLVIDTFWISILYDSNSYLGYFVSRIPQFIIISVMNVVIIMILEKILPSIKKYAPEVG